MKKLLKWILDLLKGLGTTSKNNDELPPDEPTNPPTKPPK